MANVVLVQGGWGGGWEWTGVADRLTARGHQVHRVTLTGLGDRAHLAGPDVGLATHADDVAGVLDMEDVHDAVLCGHSYGGVVVTQVSAQLPQRIASTLYLDAFVPHVGESLTDLLPPDLRALLRANLRDGWAVECPFRHEPGPMLPEVAQWYDARARPQPLRTLTDPVTAVPPETHPRGYVRFVDAGNGQEAFLRASAERARRAGWWQREVAGVHDAQITSPDAVATAIDEFVRR